MEPTVKVKDIVQLLNTLAPPESAMEWDNVGLLAGDGEARVHKLLLALDCCDTVISEAEALGAQMIITHHPVIVSGIKRVTTADADGKRLIRLLRGGISVYSAHTNFDLAQGGTNDVLFDALGLNARENLMIDNAPMGRAGILPEPITLKAMAEKTAAILHTGGIAFVGQADTAVQKIGLCTGSASKYPHFQAAKALGCDAYVTGEISYHNAQLAQDMGLNLIDAPHFATEIIGIQGFYSFLTEELTKRHWPVACFLTKAQKDVFHYVS